MGLGLFGNRRDFRRPNTVKQKDPEILLGFVQRGEGVSECSANPVNFSHNFLWTAPFLKIQFVFRFPLATPTAHLNIISPQRHKKYWIYLKYQISSPPPCQPPPKDIKDIENIKNCSPQPFHSPPKDIKNMKYIKKNQNSPPPPYQPPPKDLPKVSWSRLQLELTPINCIEVECRQKMISCKNRRDTSQLFFTSVEPTESLTSTLWPLTW